MDTKVFEILKTMGTQMPAMKKERQPLLLQIFQVSTTEICFQGAKLKRLDFHEGKSTESKCNKTVVDHITQILVEYHIHTTIISEYKQ